MSAPQLIEETFHSSVSAAKMFNAFLDSNDILPTLMPDTIKSIKYVRGNGEPGSIKQIEHIAANSLTMKHRIDELDKENFTCKYSITEGDVFRDQNIKSVSHKLVCVPAANGECDVKLTGEYCTMDPSTLPVAEIKAMAKKQCEVLEDYVKKNPHAYN